jgi:hypothetical protein
MTKDIGFQFREMCRQNTRDQLEALRGELGKQLRVTNGDAFVLAMIERAERNLAGQQERDVYSVVRCPGCRQRNRVPGSVKTRCAKCKGDLT